MLDDESQVKFDKDGHDLVFTRAAALQLLFELAALYGYELVELAKAPDDAIIH